MEHQYNTQQINRVHTVLHGLWSGGGSPQRYPSYSPRVTAYVEADNETTRQDALDLLDEERGIAAARSAIYQQDLRRYHSRRVRTRTFQEGDLVLRLIQDQTDMHKLSPPWEGPCVVSKNLHNGS